MCATFASRGVAVTAAKHAPPMAEGGDGWVGGRVSLAVNKRALPTPGAYRLTICGPGAGGSGGGGLVSLVASDGAGLLYGSQTLAQLVDAYAQPSPPTRPATRPTRRGRAL